MRRRRYRRNPLSSTQAIDLAELAAIGLGVFIVVEIARSAGGAITNAGNLASSVVTGAEGLANDIMTGAENLGTEAVQGIEGGAQTVGNWFASLFTGGGTPSFVTPNLPNITNPALFNSNFAAWYQQVIVNGAPSLDDLQAAQQMTPFGTPTLPGNNSNALNFDNPNLFGQAL